MSESTPTTPGRLSWALAAVRREFPGEEIECHLEYRPATGGAVSCIALTASRWRILGVAGTFIHLAPELPWRLPDGTPLLAAAYLAEELGSDRATVLWPAEGCAGEVEAEEWTEVTESVTELSLRPAGTGRSGDRLEELVLGMVTLGEHADEQPLMVYEDLTAARAWVRAYNGARDPGDDGANLRPVVMVRRGTEEPPLTPVAARELMSRRTELPDWPEVPEEERRMEFGLEEDPGELEPLQPGLSSGAPKADAPGSSTLRDVE